MQVRLDDGHEGQKIPLFLRSARGSASSCEARLRDVRIGMASDAYEVLGVARESDAETIKRAYKKLARELHPDRAPNEPEAVARFKAVNAAYAILSDARKRALYDEFGEAGLRDRFDPERARATRKKEAPAPSSARASSAAGPSPVRTVRVRDVLVGEPQDDLGRGPSNGLEMLGDLLGRKKRSLRGADYETEVELELVESLRGVVLRLEGLRTRQAWAPPTVDVKIPRGSGDGDRVRVPDEGAPSPAGGPNGDLVVVVRVRAHPSFRREGMDLHVDLPLSVKEAYSGAKVRVPTVDGPVELRVPPRSQTGMMLRLRGKGVAKEGAKPGDLYVRFQVHAPTLDSPEIEKLVDRLEALESKDLRADLRL